MRKYFQYKSAIDQIGTIQGRMDRKIGEKNPAMNPPFMGFVRIFRFCGSPRLELGPDFACEWDLASFSMIQIFLSPDKHRFPSLLLLFS